MKQKACHIIGTVLFALIAIAFAVALIVASIKATGSPKLGLITIAISAGFASLLMLAGYLTTR